jgi:hypothetical protein
LRKVGLRRAVQIDCVLIKAILTRRKLNRQPSVPPPK